MEERREILLATVLIGTDGFFSSAGTNWSDAAFWGGFHASKQCRRSVLRRLTSAIGRRSSSDKPRTSDRCAKKRFYPPPKSPAWAQSILAMEYRARAYHATVATLGILLVSCLLMSLPCGIGTASYRRRDGPASELVTHMRTHLFLLFSYLPSGN